MMTDVADLKNLEEARIDAARPVGALLQAHAAKIWVDEDWEMEVTDEQGLILFGISISATKSSATHHDPALEKTSA